VNDNQHIKGGKELFLQASTRLQRNILLTKKNEDRIRKSLGRERKANRSLKRDAIVMFYRVEVSKRMKGITLPQLMREVYGSSLVRGLLT